MLQYYLSLPKEIAKNIERPGAERGGPGNCQLLKCVALACNVFPSL